MTRNSSSAKTSCAAATRSFRRSRDELAEWEAMLCDAGEGERLAFRPALQRQLEKFIALLENRAEYLQSLQKPSLKALFETHTVKNNKELKFGQNFMCRCYPKLSQEQKDELAEWEAMLCDAGEGERLAFRPALQRQLEKFIALLENRAEYLQSLQKPSLKSLFEVHATKTDKELKFCQHFMDRCYPQLYRSKRTSWPSGRPCFVSLARASAWRFGRRCSDSWKSLSLCSKIEPSTRACRSLRLNLCLKRTPGKMRRNSSSAKISCFAATQSFHRGRRVALLASRRAEFLQEKESSLGVLFRAARRGRDKDWRFGHEFVSRVLPKLSAEMAAQLQQAAASCLCPAERAARKAPHEPKLHVEECALGDDLPRPRHSEERNVASDGLGDGGLAAAGGLPTAAPRRDLLIADLVMYLRSVVVRSGGQLAGATHLRGPLVS